jgi:hypothetical protein
MNDNSACGAKLGSALVGVRAFAMDMPKTEETMQWLLRDYPVLLASLSDLIGPIHVFPDVESRDAACRRFNPGVFEMRPVSTEQAEGVCRDIPTIGFAIGPAIHSATFAAVENMVIAAQMRSLHVIDGVRRFIIEADQVQYHVEIDRRNQVVLRADNRLGCRPEIDLINTRHWLAAKIALIFEASGTATVEE